MKFSFRFVIIAAFFVTCLLTANIVGVKVFRLAGSITLPAAVILFPLTYILGDVLTEVYGYKQARRVIWLGFLGNLLFVLAAWVGRILPPALDWGWQGAYEDILGYTPRLLAASFIGYLGGEFGNSFVLAKMKILTQGRWLWGRTISSTIVGQGLDTALFIPIAYYGASFFTPMMILYHLGVKVLIEVVFTPFTYAVVNYLKKREMIDAFDYETNFNPFSVTD